MTTKVHSNLPTEYFAPCGLSIGESMNPSTQQFLSLLFKKCSICASRECLDLSAQIEGHKGDLTASCIGLPMFPQVPTEI